MGDLVVDLGGIVDETGDLQPQQLAIPLPESTQSDFRRIQRNAETARMFRRGSFPLREVKEALLQHRKTIHLPGVIALDTETLERVREDTAGPLLFVGDRRIGGIMELMVRLLQREVLRIFPAPLLPGAMAVFRGKKIFENRQQPVAEATFRGMNSRRQILLE